ncbi:diadenylate cyclase CdaA [Streptococcus hillyeri]|uniref:Diadenylate cyclase n=1 Tax=Streptococcus hillyeri TaxID=2282420 RepID=A0A3L9DVB2_9STRE|nr:diadenylate cyclase CdaA [Streptococcus hillyeri]RLY05181.1 TIGR00159 family protein [Streptococcus hillyeri]
MKLLSHIDANYWASLVSSPWVLAINILDIVIVAYLIYRSIKALAGTKVMTLIQGTVFFVLTKFVAEWLGFATISYLMNQVITYGIIAGVVIFAPEIRAGLERFGRATNVFIGTQVVKDEEKVIEALVKSVAYMSPRKIGALMSIEGTQTLREYKMSGIPLNADISSQLLINIFIPNTPLHDGAVIIEGNKVATACSYLPLSESQAISKEFGTRHRAAIGLSEHSDALTVIVSEETGAISVAYKDNFIHDLSVEKFEALLRSLLVTEEVQESFWKRWFGGKKV